VGQKDFRSLGGDDKISFIFHHGRHFSHLSLLHLLRVTFHKKEGRKGVTQIGEDHPSSLGWDAVVWMTS